MDIYTLDRNFKRVDLIDSFESAIWKEGLYGDGNFELHVPLSQESYDSLALDTLMECEQSDIPMMLDTRNIEDGMIKAEGISLLEWMNNRFIRSYPWKDPTTLNDVGVSDNTWLAEGTPGAIMANIVQYWLVGGSTYLQDGDVYPVDNGGTPGHPKETTNWNDDSMGIWKPSVFAIPGLVIAAWDNGGSSVKASVSFGPVFDELKKVAETYGVGQKITLDSVTDASYTLGYRNFRGLDRTSGQSVRPVVRFSPDVGPIKDIREFQSSRDRKTRVYIWTTEIEDIVSIGDTLETNYDFYGDGTLVYNFEVEGTYFDDINKATSAFDKNYVGPTGFDMKVGIITDAPLGPWDIGYERQEDAETGEVNWGRYTPQYNTYRTNYENALGPLGRLYLSQNKIIKTVDGELDESPQYEYGVDYGMGDILELEGYSGTVGKIRVVEFVRSQDATGEKSYPGVQVVE